MKKFLALLVVLSLTVFAGSAFAAISTNPAAVNVTAGSTATVSVTARTTHDGELGAISFTGPEWATFDGTSTITFAPGTSVTGTYTATVSVTESYSVADPSAAGHTRTETETATANVTVNVTAPVAPLTLTATPATTTIMAGESTAIALTSTGGTGAKVFTLSELVDGLSISGSTAIFAPKTAGTYLLAFIVTDEAGRTQVAATTITVAEVFAASATISKNPVSVDEQVTVRLIATGGIGAANFTTSTAGVSLGTTTNNAATATFRSAESGIFTLSFTAADGAGHTATVNVSVIVDAPAPEPEAEDVVEEVVSQDVRETITATSHTLSSDLTTEVNEDAINNTMSKNAGAAIASDDSYTSADKALAEGIDERNEATVDELKNAGAFPEDAESLPQEDVTVTPSSNTDLAGTVAKDNANTGRGSSAPIMGFGVSSPRDGIVKVPAPRQPVNLWGLIIRVLKAVVNVNNRAMPGFTAAADGDDTDTTVFLDSNGNVTTTIPTSFDVNGNPRIGGFMTIATYVKANEPVDMIFSVPTEELEAAGITTETKEVEVELPTFSASGTGFFTTFVSSDLLTNTNYYRIGENVLTSKANDTVVRNDWARTAEERQMATDNNYTMITRLASIDATAEADTHTYIVAAVFSADQAKKDRIDTTENGGFIFYPNGPANAAGAAEVLKLVARDDGTYGFDDLTPADIKDGVTKGYLAFSVTGGAAATKPMLAVKLLPPEVPTFAFVLSKNNVTVKQGETETAEITAVNNSGDVDYFIAENGFDWITIDGNIVTFAPTTSTAARTYTATIYGVDDALAEYSQDVTVTVTSAGGTDSGDVPTPTTSLGLTASATELTLRRGQVETVTLTASNVLGTATYSVEAEDDAGVTLTDNVVKIEPKNIGLFTITCVVTDSGRTTGRTATAYIRVTVTPGSVSSSGGGCDAGFGVLALAVLGGLIAARKK